MDARLVAIAESVEDSGEPYRFPLIVHTGGALVVGRPAPSTVLLSAGRDHVWQAVQKASKRKTPEEERQRVFAETVASLDKAFAEPLPEITALTLADAEWWPPQGDGLQLPAVRVPFDAVSAWWIARGTVKKAGSAGGWFVGGGVSFPLN